MFVSAVLSIIGLGIICWVLFTLAVYALPFFVAVTVGHYAYNADIGLIGAIAAAFFAGAATLILGQIAFATIRSTPIRLTLGAFYALPAGIAGFHAIKGLSGMGGAGETWTLVFASVGAVVVGVTAWARVASLVGPEEDAPAASRAFSANASRAANDG
ncbi:hypothetical protein [Algihabitans albus]|uniref:hypothetical protein n=1 Tax=Algihabitans albus TaxID=2164067 RepID=UPI001ABC62EA|nr:hypothetical protein [Algihabitans albus]